MQTYVVVPAALQSDIFANALPAFVDHYHPSGTPDYEPSVQAWMVWDQAGLYVRMRAYEADIRATRTAKNADVWCDSCLECFLNLAPEKDEKYINIEINALGTMLLGFGDDAVCSFQDFDPADYAVTPALDLTVPCPYWQITYQIPWAAMTKFFGPLAPQAGYAFRGNFFKCGDQAVPHFGSWSQVDPTKPGRFHTYAYFGEFILANTSPPPSLENKKVE